MRLFNEAHSYKTREGVQKVMDKLLADWDEEKNGVIRYIIGVREDGRYFACIIGNEHSYNVFFNQSGGKICWATS